MKFRKGNWKICYLLTPPSEARGGYTKSIHSSLRALFVGSGDVWVCELIAKFLHLNRIPRKNAVYKMISSTRSSKLNHTKKIFFHFYAQILAKHFDRFFEFLNFDHFRRRFTTVKQSLQKKSHIPQRSPRKDEDFVHLTFLIFKLLSHNFLNDRWGDF